MKRGNKKTTRVIWLLCFGIIPALAGVLRLLGRVWWCKVGDKRIYVNEVWHSSHTSQHLFDPYSFTHVLHGVLFFWVTGLLFRSTHRLVRFLVALFGEAAWEVLENSDYIIHRYRQNTASVDYFGDSIANSAGDVLACAIGFWVAAKLGWRWSLAFFVAVEIGLLFWIRDSLLLNVLMLVCPVEWIKAWQAAI